jgi:hypothetical protein
LNISLGSSRLAPARQSGETAGNLLNTRQVARRECHDERTPNPPGSQEATHHDPQREEECQEIEGGSQEQLSGKWETGLIATDLQAQTGLEAPRSQGGTPAEPGTC